DDHRCNPDRTDVGAPAPGEAVAAPPQRPRRIPMIVRQWMSTKFVLLPIETSLPDALRFLNSKGINLVGVLRHGHVAGAVTRSEIYEMLESGDPMTLLSRKTL